MIMKNINTNIQYTLHYILNKDKQNATYQKKLTGQVQWLLKLLKKVAVVPTNYFNNASEV